MSDFSKAFDRINHNILVYKLRLLKIVPIQLYWYTNFLKHCHQCVKLGSFTSSWKPIHVGIPQGTKLGPTFFLMMIKDLHIELPMYKNVDKCTIFEVTPISSRPLALQHEFGKISK